MRSATSRRSILGAVAAASTAATVPAVAQAEPVDPHPAWGRIAAASIAELDSLIDETDPDEVLADQAYERYSRHQELIFATPARTPAGAVEQIRASLRIHDLGCVPDMEAVRRALHTLDCWVAREASP